MLSSLHMPMLANRNRPQRAKTIVQPFSLVHDITSEDAKKFAERLGTWVVGSTSVISLLAAVLPSGNFFVAHWHYSILVCTVIPFFVVSSMTAVGLWEARKQIDPVIGFRAVLHSPCNAQMTREVNRLGAQYYGSEAIPLDRFDGWRLKNPNILACLIDGKGSLAGYFDVLPLESRFLDEFIAGNVEEGAISHENILAPADAKTCNRLYLAGIAVRGARTYAGRVHASILIWGLSQYLQHYYPMNRRRQLFALAATSAGENLTQKFGFNIVSPRISRKDGHNLYECNLTPATFSDAMTIVPEWGRSCKLSWNR